MSVEYVIATGEGWRELTAEVTKLIQEGWVCQGGVCIAVGEGDNSDWCYQAMVRLPPQKSEVHA